MNPPSVWLSEESDSEVSSLIKALGETERRLEELTEGQVDTFLDRDGRSFMLSRVQEVWRRSGEDKQAAILDALPAQVVVLNREGVIVAVNNSWRRSADTNGLCDRDYGIGMSYLAVCEQAAGYDATDAIKVATGLRAVLDGSTRSFALEYGCHTLAGMQWFLLTAAPVNEKSPRGAVVLHLDITEQRRGREDSHLFAAAMDASADGIYLIDRADMRMVHANDAACRIHELTREQVLALKPWEILGNNTQEGLERTYDALIVGGGFAQPEEALLYRDGKKPIWIEYRRHAQRIGDRWTIVALVRDVTARKGAESRIAYLSRVHAVLSGINTLNMRVRDRDELFSGACRIAVNQGALAMAWIGMLDPSLNKIAVVASAGMDEDFLADITLRLDAHPIGSPGEYLPVRVITDKSVFVSNDSQNEVKNYFRGYHAKLGIQSFALFPLIIADEAVGVLVLYAREIGFFHDEECRLLTELSGDVAFAIEQIEKQERLDYLAYYDVITGLANRRLFTERAAQYLRSAAAGDHKVAVCFIDLERFRNINDSLGRAVGDKLLRQVADWLVEDLGDPNILARIDADSFAIVLPIVRDEEEVARILEKTIKAFLDHSFQLNEKTYRVAAKFGIAMYPEDGGDVDILFQHATSALKKAKVGGDRYLFYAQKMTETVVGRLDLENQLRRALELDEFVLHYQPKIDLATGRLVGAEALIRWNDPLNGLVPPGRFIPILEDTGLIHEVGRWALHRAMQDYLKWRDAGLAVVRIAVNLSPLQLRNRNLIADIREVIGMDSSASAGLELELTESLIMDDVKLSISRLQAIRDMGISIAIDDFGTGFSSLSYLARLPVDTVKIDRSFIDAMTDGSEGVSLVSTIITLAHSLKLKVVAEGVETVEQARLLREMKCDEMQGFLISKALPSALFAERYLGSRA